MYVRCHRIYRMCKDTVYMHVHMYVRYHRIYRICKHTVYDMCTCLSILHWYGYYLLSCVWWMHCCRYSLFQMHTAWSFTVLGPLVWKQFVPLVIEDSCLWITEFSVVQSRICHSPLVWFSSPAPRSHCVAHDSLQLAASSLSFSVLITGCTILPGFGSPVREATQLDFVII